MLTIILMLIGCNPCQQLCSDMAKYAEECGIDVSSSEIDTCVEAQSDVSSEQKKSCSQARPELETEWSCEDVERYFASE